MIKYVLVNDTFTTWYTMADHPSKLQIIDNSHIEKWIYIKDKDGCDILYKKEKMP